jgi:hypothetical protein
MLFELDVELETDPGYEQEAEHVAELAQERCLVESALEAPVHLSVRVPSATTAPASA